jgi:lipopolysaccharide/colanic/teichoic acid biosynthesis glycosyltransferase/acetyltransferase-like isoleucine patch superfamily enzyme
MRIWPVLLDSQPSYLHGRGRSSSLLLAPLGTSVLVQHLSSALAGVTNNPPLVVAGEGADDRYAEWIRAVCPAADVVGTAAELASALAAHELSDAVLFVDPRCMPLHGFEFSALVAQHVAQPRVSHHLVAFDRAAAGTKERVCFDASGQIRGIQRLYEHATWPFISGIAASIVPSACGVVAEGTIPRSLAEVRQLVITRGVPIRDVALDAGALDLTEERGMLAANEQFILAATSTRSDDALPAFPLRVGEGQTIAASARLMGPIVVHPRAVVDENATVLGPAVIGEGARIGAGAIVAHTIVGSDCVVPANAVVRDRAWFRSSGENTFGVSERPPVSYAERLARLSIDAHARTALEHEQPQARRSRFHAAKRALDILVATIGLTVTAPLFLIVTAAIWLESKGPLFYGDKREGWRGRAFNCWKFRTMFTGAHLAQRELKALDHTDGPHFKIDHDPRVTRVGRVLRALNLDEIPQLVNVLVGDMSLVGPRPSPFRENQVCVPWRAARLSVRPGITGFWQVCRHNRSAGDFQQWIEYDLLYVQNQSLLLDLKILAATLLTGGGKIAHVPASWLVAKTTTVIDDSIPSEAAAQSEHQAEQVA